MSFINFDQLFDNLKTGVESVAKESVQDYVDQAKTDGEDALDSLKDNLQRWAIEVESGALTSDDLEFLLQEETALDEMKALKQEGLAAIQIDKFKNGLVNMIVGSMTGLVKA